jgi:hypothetical protein
MAMMAITTNNSMSVKPRRQPGSERSVMGPSLNEQDNQHDTCICVARKQLALLAVQ